MHRHLHIPTALRSIFRTCKKNAAVRGIEFELTLQDIFEMYAECGGRCSLSGIEFDLHNHEDTYRRAWSPSIDRISSKDSYSRLNCRLVCTAVNFALGEWGEQVLLKIAEGLVARSQTPARECIQPQPTPAVRIEGPTAPELLPPTPAPMVADEELTSPHQGEGKSNVVTQEDPLRNSASLCTQLGGISQMTLWRWTEIGYIPKPDRLICGRKYWLQSTISAAAERIPRGNPSHPGALGFKEAPAADTAPKRKRA